LGKPPEFLGIELALVVAADDATDHYQDAQRIGLFDEAAQRVGPGAELAALLEIKISARSRGSRQPFSQQVALGNAPLALQHAGVFVGAVRGMPKAPRVAALQECAPPPAVRSQGGLSST
jgi:hypothetical protein